MRWFHLGQQPTPTPFSHRMGRKNEKKAKRLMDAENDNLVGKPKAACNQSEKRNLFTPSHQEVDVQLLNGVSACVLFSWEEKCHSHKHVPFFPASSLFGSLHFWLLNLHPVPRVVQGGWGDLNVFLIK